MSRRTRVSMIVSGLLICILFYAGAVPATERSGASPTGVNRVLTLDGASDFVRVPDVPALHGWRRELFGEKALALKHGRLALAIEKGRVTTIERD